MKPINDPSKFVLTAIAIDLSDRLGRKIFLLADNKQKTVIGAWIETDPNAMCEMEITGKELYQSIASMFDGFGTLAPREKAR